MRAMPDGWLDPPEDTSFEEIDALFERMEIENAGEAFKLEQQIKKGELLKDLPDGWLDPPEKTPIEEINALFEKLTKDQGERKARLRQGSTKINISKANRKPRGSNGAEKSGKGVHTGKDEL